MVLEWEALEGRSGHEAGRQLLARMYESCRGKPLPAVLTAPGGKPYLEGETLHFSISHTKKHVFCVLSDRPVGVDAEEADRDIDLRLARKILSPGELAQYEAAADRRLALLTFWVLKEAEVKRTGQGLRGYPNHTNFFLDDSRVRKIAGCLVAVAEE